MCFQASTLQDDSAKRAKNLRTENVQWKNTQMVPG